MYPLHFGHFAGLLSKAVWGALGVAMCFVILSGFRLWVRRRADAAGLARLRPRGADHRLRPADRHAGLGLRLLPVAPGRRSVLVDALELRARRRRWRSRSACAVADEDRLGRRYQRLLGAACLVLPVLRLATGGMDWAEALLARQTDVLTVDLLLLVAGASLLAGTRAAARRARRRRPSLEPAE